jgi:hypothetical protein
VSPAPARFRPEPTLPGLEFRGPAAIGSATSMLIAGADQQRICDNLPVTLGGAAKDKARLVGWCETPRCQGDCQGER